MFRLKTKPLVLITVVILAIVGETIALLGYALGVNIYHLTLFVSLIVALGLIYELRKYKFVKMRRR